jgi:hypothetical protein
MHSPLAKKLYQNFVEPFSSSSKTAEMEQRSNSVERLIWGHWIECIQAAAPSARSSGWCEVA